VLPEALALNFARHFSNRKRSASTKNLGFSHYDTCIFSGCTSIILLDLKESECAEAVNELTGFAVGEVLLLLTSNFKFSSIFFSEKCGFDSDVLRFTGIECDVSSEESVQTAFATIIGRYGKLDAVVASAGIVENYPALE